MVTLDLRLEVEKWHALLKIYNITAIIGTDRSLRTLQQSRYHVPQNVYLVILMSCVLLKQHVIC